MQAFLLVNSTVIPRIIGCDGYFIFITIFHNLVLQFLKVVYYDLTKVISAVVVMHKRNAIKIRQDVLLDLFSTFFFGHFFHKLFAIMIITPIDHATSRAMSI